MSEEFSINDPEIIKEFVNEFREHIQNMESSLIELEKEPDNPDLIKVIFRMAHNIKGASSYLDLKNISAFTHKLENILDRCRKGTTKISPPILDALFHCTDVLKQQVEEFVNTGSDAGVDISGIMKELNAITSGRQRAGLSKGKEAEKSPLGVENDIPVEIFLNSAAQHLEILETGYGKLNEGDQSVENLDKLFRAFGGLKGAAIVMGYEGLRDVMDKQAVLVDALRAGAIKINKTFLAVMGQVLGLLLKFVDNKKHGVEVGLLEGEFKDLGESLEELQGTVPSLEKKKKPGEGQEKNVFEDQTLRVSERRLDHMMNLIGELVILKNRFVNLNKKLNIAEFRKDAVGEVGEATAFMTRISDELQSMIMGVRMVPISTVFNKFPRMVRDFSKKSNKKIEFKIEGEETEVDKTIIEKIGDPLGHLVRNAIDHGIEGPGERTKQGKQDMGTVRLRACHEGDHVVIEVRDDGRGMNPEILKKKAIEKELMSASEAERLSAEDALKLIFLPGFSTAKEITDVSGRGVGMDVVKDNIRKLNGEVIINSEVGQGSTVSIRLPLTLAIVKVLMVGLGEETYAFPLSSVDAIVKLKASEVFSVGGGQAIYFRGQTLMITKLKGIFRLNGTKSNQEQLPIVVISVGEKKYGFIIDRFLGNQDVVIKPLEGVDSHSNCISGSAILGDGSVALIINPMELIGLSNMKETGTLK